MTKRDSTRILWRVQVRKSRAHKWVNKGTFETRENARAAAARLRGPLFHQTVFDYGFGNTRVVRIVKGCK